MSISLPQVVDNTPSSLRRELPSYSLSLVDLGASSGFVRHSKTRITKRSFSWRTADEGSERRHNPTLCKVTGVSQRTLKGLDCFRQVTSILCATLIGGLGETFSPLTAITSAWMDAWRLMLRHRSWPRLPNEHDSFSEHCMVFARDCKIHNRK